MSDSDRWERLEATEMAGDRLAEVIEQRDELYEALLSLEQAYMNSHSPQHRAACLAQARAAIAKVSQK